MKFLKRVDTALLDRGYQRAADSLLRLCGCDFLLVSDIAFIISICFFVRYFQDDLAAYRAGDQRRLLLVVANTVSVPVLALVYVAFQKIRRVIRETFVNPLRLVLWVPRLGLMLCLAVELVAGANPMRTMNTFFYASSMYFLSCTPKPRQKNALRKLWEKARKALAPTRHADPAHAACEVHGAETGAR